MQSLCVRLANVAKGTNQPLGSLALADLIGLDTVLAICECLHRELGDDKYRPAPLLRRYVATGWLGKKYGQGFYSYNTAHLPRSPLEVSAPRLVFAPLASFSSSA